MLVAPSVGGEQPSEEVCHFAQQEDALFEQGDLSGATELNMRLWVDGPQRTPHQVNPTVRQRVYEMQYHAFTVPMPENADEQVLEPPAITRLAEVRVPALIIVGNLDLPEKSLELTEQLATSIPGARREIIARVLPTWSLWSNRRNSTASCWISCASNNLMLYSPHWRATVPIFFFHRDGGPTEEVTHA